MLDKSTQYFLDLFNEVRTPKAEIEIGKILNERRGKFSDPEIKQTCILVCDQLDFSFADLPISNRYAISAIITNWCWWNIKRVSEVVSGVYENYLVG